MIFLYREAHSSCGAYTRSLTHGLCCITRLLIPEKVWRNLRLMEKIYQIFRICGRTTLVNGMYPKLPLLTIARKIYSFFLATLGAAYGTTTVRHSSNLHYTALSSYPTHWTKFWIYMGVNVMQITRQISSTLFTLIFSYMVCKCQSRLL